MHKIEVMHLRADILFNKEAGLCQVTVINTQAVNDGRGVNTFKDTDIVILDKLMFRVHNWIEAEKKQ